MQIDSKANQCLVRNMRSLILCLGSASSTIPETVAGSVLSFILSPCGLSQWGRWRWGRGSLKSIRQKWRAKLWSVRYLKLLKIYLLCWIFFVCFCYLILRTRDFLALTQPNGLEPFNICLIFISLCSCSIFIGTISKDKV